MTVTDPLVPALTGLIVDLVWWLDSCDDEEVDPDAAVRMMETVSWVLRKLPEDQRARLIGSLTELAAAERNPERRDFLLSFPADSGLAGGSMP